MRSAHVKLKTAHLRNAKGGTNCPDMGTLGWAGLGGAESSWATIKRTLDLPTKASSEQLRPGRRALFGFNSLHSEL